MMVISYITEERHLRELGNALTEAATRLAFRAGIMSCKGNE
jgi:hypothetical protein